MQAANDTAVRAEFLSAHAHVTGRLRRRPGEQSAYLRRWHEARIRKALLAGDRPCMNRRPPTRWVRVAKQLGIQLTEKT